MNSYIEYVINTDSLRDRAGSLQDFLKWQVQQIYLFKTRQSIDNVGNSCSIQCEIKAINTAQSTNMFILGLYDEYLSIGFDEFGQHIS